MSSTEKDVGVGSLQALREGHLSPNCLRIMDGGECVDLEFLEPFELELAKSHDQGGCAKPLMPSLRPAKKVWTFPTPSHTKGLLFTPGRSSEK